MTSDEMYDVVCLIGQARGNKKKEILAKHPELKNMLRTTYDPFRHFGIRPTSSWQSKIGEGLFDSSTASLLAGLSSGQYSGNDAKRRVKQALENLTFKSGQLLLRILNKDLRMGLGSRSINTVFPGLIPSFPIQLAKLYEHKRVKYPVYVSPKLDGLRAIYKDGEFYSRRGHKFSGLDKLATALTSILPYGYQLDGELMVEGKHFNEISGDIRAFRDTDNAVYHVFDRPNSYFSFKHRIDELRDLLNDHTLSIHKEIKLVPHYLINEPDELNEYVQYFYDQGYEGTMVKDPDGLYLDRRTYDWMKIKQTLTFDCPVIGTFQGKGKYVGMVGGLIVSFNGVPVRVGSGLSDAQRRLWTAHEWESAVAEVACQEVTPDGSLRHPRLITLRGDL